jgi:hypothetical protein
VTLFADVVSFSNQNPGIASAVAAAVTAYVTAKSGVRSGFRAEARKVAREESKAAVAQCRTICLTPHPRAPGA